MLLESAPRKFWGFGDNQSEAQGGVSNAPAASMTPTTLDRQL